MRIGIKLYSVILAVVLSVIGVVVATGTAPTVEIHNLTAEYPIAISVLFNTSGNGTYLINDTTNFQINQTGFLQNITNLVPKYPGTALYWLNISANESEANASTSNIIWVNITDTTKPTLPVHNMTAEYPYRVSVQFNATDNYLLGNYTVNNTNINYNWTIHGGLLQNVTHLPPLYPKSAALYWINLTVNDTLNNSKHVLLWVNITDTVAPTVSLHNVTVIYPANISVLFNFTDNYETDSFSVNNTDVFQINKTGSLTNLTDIGNDIYPVKITANDSFNNTINIDIIVNAFPYVPVDEGGGPRPRTTVTTVAEETTTTVQETTTSVMGVTSTTVVSGSAGLPEGGVTGIDLTQVGSVVILVIIILILVVLYLLLQKKGRKSKR